MESKTPLVFVQKKVVCIGWIVLKQSFCFCFLQEITNSNVVVFPSGTMGNQIAIVLLEKMDVSASYQIQIDLRACFETGKVLQLFTPDDTSIIIFYERLFNKLLLTSEKQIPILFYSQNTSDNVSNRYKDMLLNVVPFLNYMLKVCQKGMPTEENLNLTYFMLLNEE